LVFKRRDRRGAWQLAREAVYPKGGWTRAFYYVRHRVNRLPDTPEKIARGVSAGVFAAFTPFYGFHFITAFIVAWVVRGNFIASAIGTFFGNPLTYVPIGVVALQTGQFLLGGTFDESKHGSFLGAFAAAATDLKDNFVAIFTEATADWSGLGQFYYDVFLPYLVGGVIPGILTAGLCYYLSVPVIRAYQNRRKGRLKAKLADIRAKKAAKKLEKVRSREIGE
jgi:uncharacterized protein (DUF2062 family)